MPVLTADQRIAFVSTLWDTFTEEHHIHREIRSDEYELARRWAHRGVPLATVLQGIVETGGKPRTLMACERGVEENISRWAQAVGGLEELPEPGPLKSMPEGE